MYCTCCKFIASCAIYFVAVQVVDFCSKFVYNLLYNRARANPNQWRSGEHLAALGVLPVIVMIAINLFNLLHNWHHARHLVGLLASFFGCCRAFPLL